MRVGFQIIGDVVWYRLRKLEMANLAATVSIATALHLSWSEIAWRTSFAFVLNVLVYLNNDYLDVQTDLQSSNKDMQKARFLAAHMPAGLRAQWLLGLLLTAAALVHDRGLLLPLCAGGGICFWYSTRLKNRPYLDIVAMMLWGVTMPLCGSPLSHGLGLSMAVQLGLFSGVFETIQVMRDSDADAAQGLSTTGVVLGPVRTLRLARALMVVTSLYGVLVLQPWLGAFSLVALLLPLRATDVERYWTQVKVVYGVTWLALCAWVFAEPHVAGLLWSIGLLAGSHGLRAGG